MVQLYWPDDGQWWPALVTAVTGSATDRRVALYYETGGAPSVIPGSGRLASPFVIARTAHFNSCEFWQQADPFFLLLCSRVCLTCKPCAVVQLMFLFGVTLPALSLVLLQEMKS